MTCRAMFTHSGKPNDVFAALKSSDPQDEAEYRFLLYLARDGMYLPDYALCQWCRKLHSPFFSTASGGSWSDLVIDSSQRRPCEQFTAWASEDRFSPVLPSRLHYNSVMAVMLSHQIRQRCSSSTDSIIPRRWPLLTPSALDHDETITGQGYRIRVLHTFAIPPSGVYKDNLLVKSEKLIHLRKRQTDAAVMESITQLTDAMMDISDHISGWGGFNDSGWEEPDPSHSICLHKGSDGGHTWLSRFPRVFMPPSLLSSSSSSSNSKKKILTQSQCLGNWSSWPPKLWSNGRIVSCRVCFTDFALSFVRGPASEVTGAGGSGGSINVCVMTTSTQLARQRIASYGAELHVVGEFWDLSWEHGRKLADERGGALLHPFADEATIAGQGTIGLEILEDMPDVETVVISIGGGGLIAGIAEAIKQRKPGCRIVGVEAAGCPTLYESRKAGHPVMMQDVVTNVPILAARATAPINFEIIKRCVDELVLVPEDEPILAAEWMWRNTGLAVELGAATAAAAVLNGHINIAAGEKTVVVLCGSGNDGLGLKA